MPGSILRVVRGRQSGPSALQEAGLQEVKSTLWNFIRIKTVPIILANFAWGSEKRGVAKWDDLKMPLTEVVGNDKQWAKKFHLWRMDWDKNTIKLYLDNRLMNSIIVKVPSIPMVSILFFNRIIFF